MTRSEYNMIVDSCANDIYRFILKACKSKEMAEDIVQDSFLKLWENVETVNFEKSKSFLFSTAYHRMIDIFRREKKYGDIEAVGDNVESDSFNYSGVQEALNFALDRLPAIQKTVVLLRDYEDYSYKEIAEITDLSESQVKVYIFRARVFMKNFIRKPDLVI